MDLLCKFNVKESTCVLTCSKDFVYLKYANLFLSLNFYDESKEEWRLIADVSPKSIFCWSETWLSNRDFQKFEFKIQVKILHARVNRAWPVWTERHLPHAIRTHSPLCMWLKKCPFPPLGLWVVVSGWGNVPENCIGNIHRLVLHQDDIKGVDIGFFSAFHLRQTRRLVNCRKPERLTEKKWQV